MLYKIGMWEIIKALLAFTDALIFYSVIIQLECKNRIKKIYKNSYFTCEIIKYCFIKFQNG